MPHTVIEGFPLSPQQARAWSFHEQSPPPYAQTVVTIDGRLDVERLGRAVERVVERHEIFRTTFPTVDGQPEQIVHDLRRSGAKHLISAGIDPHTVMQFTGHKTPSMLRRYHIIDLDDRRAATQAAAFAGSRGANVRALSENPHRTRTVDPNPGSDPEAAKR